MAISKESIDAGMQAIVNASDEEKIEKAVRAYVQLEPILKRIDPDNGGMGVLCCILGCAAAADGELNESEAKLIKSLINAFQNEATLGYEDVARIVSGVNERTYDHVRNLANNLRTNDDYYALVDLIAAVCSIDDRISSNEVAYIISFFE